MLHPNPTAQPGVLELPAAEQLALDASIDGLRAAAVETIRECRLARARAKQQKDDLRRIQGRDDIERLTVPLMQEELHARRSRILPFLIHAIVTRGLVEIAAGRLA